MWILFQYHTHIALTIFDTVYWGGIVSTILLFHATFAINSFGHTFGKKVYMTGDESRNNIILAILTLGEGWHNNHHHWPISAKQGFNWKQVDISYYLLYIMAHLRIISHIINVPHHKVHENKLCE